MWGSLFSYPASWRFSKKLALAQVLLLDLEKWFIWMPLGLAIFKIAFFLWHLELALNDIIILILLHSCHLRLEILEKAEYWEFLHFLHKTYCNAFLIWHLSTPFVINHVAWHCVKRICIRSYSGPNFPEFGLNTERYSVSLRIQSECGKIRTRITPNTDTFYSVWKSLIILSMNLQSPFCSSKLGLHSNGYKVLWYLKSFLFFLL